MTHELLDRNLALELVRVTEAAALAASKLIGRGDEKAADQAAVDAMRTGARTTSPSTAPSSSARASATRRRCSTSARRSAPGGPEDRHRARSAGRHHDHRQGRPQRAGRDGHGASRAASSTRPTSTWTRSPVGAGLPDGVIDLDDSAGGEPARRWPRPRACELADIVVCILDRAAPCRDHRQACARPARASC